jgi:protein gp37
VRSGDRLSGHGCRLAWRLRRGPSLRRSSNRDPEAGQAAVRFLSIEPLLEDVGQLDLTGIDWVIVGGESGRGARPMRREWVASIRDECRAAAVPFFFKQWGGVWKKRAGRLFEGRTWDEMPSRPTMLSLLPSV